MRGVTEVRQSKRWQSGALTAVLNRIGSIAGRWQVTASGSSAYRLKRHTAGILWGAGTAERKAGDR